MVEQYQMLIRVRYFSFIHSSVALKPASGHFLMLE